jgi:hypothetical protein
VAPQEILNNLVMSIRLREKVTARNFGSKDGGDLGHQYIIDVLKFCYGALQFANRMAAAVTHDNDVSNTIGGRFTALTLDDFGEEEEEEVDWNDMDIAIQKGDLPQYEGLEVEEEIGIHKYLLKGDDEFQVVALLLTMNDAMGRIRGHYELLKDFMHESPLCMRVIMECAVVANIATRIVYQAENELALEHPHLSSFYHVLAFLFYSTIVEDINKVLKQTKKEKDPYMALQFVAEMVELSFYEAAGQTHVPSTVKRFVKKSGLEQSYVDRMAGIIHNYTCWETLLGIEERTMGIVADETSETGILAPGMRPHTWFGPLKNIGGDSCILNTQKLVQIIAMGFKGMSVPGEAPEHWAPPFDEDKSPAKRIRGDLDGIFAFIILPELLMLCRDAPIDYLPEGSHLITVLDLLHRHVKGNLTKAVPISLTFGLHAILMSIFVLHGDGDLARVAVNAKQSYSMLFEQLQTGLEESKVVESAPLVHKYVHAYGSMEGFAKLVRPSDDPSYKVDPLQAEMLTLWNPLLGGGYMLHATYICSIELGTATINSMGQLRSVLHLYNGLRRRDPTFEIPLLRDLDKFFERDTCIWVDGKPEKGSCCEMFWLAWGLNPKLATSISSNYTANGDPRYDDWTIEALFDLRR